MQRTSDELRTDTYRTIVDHAAQVLANHTEAPQQKAQEALELSYNSLKAITKLPDGIVTSHIEELPAAQTDFVLTAVGLSVAAADEAQKGNYEHALAEQYIAYELLCVSEFLRCGIQSCLDSINPVSYAQAIARGLQAEVQRGLQEHYENLAVISTLAKKLGFLKSETIQEIDEVCVQYEHKQYLIAQEISRAIQNDIAHTFSDGVVLGLSRIGGQIAGNFLGPIAVEKGLIKATAICAKIKCRALATFAEIEKINRARQAIRQKLQTELSQAERLLKETVETAQAPQAQTPGGIEIPVQNAEGLTAFMEGEEVAHEAAKLRHTTEVKPITEAAVEHEIPAVVENVKSTIKLQEEPGATSSAAAPGVQAAEDAEAVAKTKAGTEGRTAQEMQEGMQSSGERPQTIAEQGQSPASEGIQERNPLDRRNMSPEQLKAEAERKAAGKMSNLSGKKFEEFLVRQLGGTGEFEVVSQKFSCTRQFDGAYGNVYYEAKAGGFWAELVKSPTALNEFQSKTIQKQKIAAELGKNFEIHTNSPIPEHIKKWLTKRGIMFHEWL